MAVVTESIGTVGRDRSTIALWEAALDDDVVYDAGDDAVGECYNDSAFDEAFPLDGGSTLGLASVELTVAAGERHDGTAGTGVRNVHSVARNMPSVASNGVEYLIKWIENDCNGKNSDGFLFPGSGGADELTLRGIFNILYHGSIGNTSTRFGVNHGYDGPFSLANSIFYDLQYQFNIQTRIIKLSDVTNTASAFNVTLHDCGATNAGASAGCNGFEYDTATAGNVQNCIATDFATAGGGTAVCFGTINATGNVDHNLSSDTTASGTGSLTEKTAADQFVSITGGSEDLHLKAGSDAEGAATPVASVTDDIDGDTRDATNPDIGADEFVSAFAPKGYGRPPRRPGGRLINVVCPDDDEYEEDTKCKAKVRRFMWPLFGRM